IDAAASSGSVDVVVARDDVLAEEDAVSNAITGVNEANAGETGAFENLQFNDSDVSTVVTDDVDTVVATLTASPESLSEEGGQITYTVTLTNKDGLPVTGHQGLTFTLADGTKVEITAGQASGSQAVVVESTDDNVIGGQDAVTNSIESVSGADAFEDLVTAGETSVAITDEPIDPSNPGTNLGDV